MTGTGPAHWLSYYEQTRDRPPHETLARAMRAFEDAGPAARHAIDLGSGIGRDSIPLLKSGWSVLAIDQTLEALHELEARAGNLGFGERLAVQQSRFEDLEALPHADLVNASFSLPFCPPETFDRIWRLVRAALPMGARFSGHFLGPRDDWAKRGGVTILPRGEVEARLSGFDIEYLWEEEDDGKTARGKPKHWHIFHITARRKGTT